MSLLFDKNVPTKLTFTRISGHVFSKVKVLFNSEKTFVTGIFIVLCYKVSTYSQEPRLIGFLNSYTGSRLSSRLNS